MSVARASSLVSSSWLRNQLLSPTNLRVLDSSWTPLKGGHEQYTEKHIPSACFFDLNKCVQPTPSLPRNLPDPPCFTEYVQSLGIDRDSQLIIYDRGGILASARAWWTFRAFGHERVSVLDGGLKNWDAEGNPTASGEELPTEKGDFVANLNQSLIRTIDDMKKTIMNGSSQILDARRPEHFHGKEEEPTTFTQKALQGMNQPMPSSIRRGHIPGSMNLLEDHLLDPETKCLLDKDELIKIFEGVGVNLSKPLTTMCYSGNAACLLALAARVCGKDDTAVYYGSWTEWGQKAEDGHIIGPSTEVASGG